MQIYVQILAAVSVIHSVRLYILSQIVDVKYCIYILHKTVTAILFLCLIKTRNFDLSTFLIKTEPVISYHVLLW